MRPSDLTATEQTNVRAALHFLHRRSGAWPALAKALRFNPRSLARVANGQSAVSASVAVCVARLAGVGVDDVLSGRYPAPGTCAYCGHTADEAAR